MKNPIWRKWLGQETANEGEARPSRDVAIAVLLLECAQADFEHAEAETAEIRQTLASRLGLSTEAVEELLGQAGDSREQAVSLHGPVSQLNDSMSADEKRQLIRWMWQVAHADGNVDPYEEHLLRQVADLLYVPHSELIQTRLDVSGQR